MHSVDRRCGEGNWRKGRGRARSRRGCTRTVVGLETFHARHVPLSGVVYSGGHQVDSERLQAVKKRSNALC